MQPISKNTEPLSILPIGTSLISRRWMLLLVGMMSCGMVGSRHSNEVMVLLGRLHHCKEDRGVGPTNGHKGDSRPPATTFLSRPA